MKLIIDTQIKENYGAHAWDGKGECPQYWKFKGGNTYVVENVDQYAGICHPYIELLDLIEMKDDSFEEYFIDAYEKEYVRDLDNLTEDDNSYYAQKQQWVIYCTRNFYGEWIGEDASGSWILGKNGKRIDYKMKQKLEVA
jgi:hypothetical protein